MTPCRLVFTLRLTSGLDPYQRDLPTKILAPRVGIMPRSPDISARVRRTKILELADSCCHACHHTSIECRDIFTQSRWWPDFQTFLSHRSQDTQFQVMGNILTSGSPDHFIPGIIFIISSPTSFPELSLSESLVQDPKMPNIS
jgi:integrase